MQEPWTAFDTETTGVNYESDFILSAAAIDISNGVAFGREWLLNWEIDIPPEAAKIHGLTRERLAAKGINPAEALDQICNDLVEHIRGGVLVGMNITFDLTMLDRNCRFLGLTPLDDRFPAGIGSAIAPVADAFVLDKYVDPYRKGRRNLEALVNHYRTGEFKAHNAAEDALMSARVCWRIGKIFPEVGAMDPVLLHELQMVEKQKQDASFRQHKLRKGEDASGLDGHWPIVPLAQAAIGVGDLSLAGGVTPSLFSEEPM
jgi:DNA polymerase-3 subunit epsilon